MSLSTQIPQFKLLPQYFSFDFVTQIQNKVQKKSDFLFALQSYQSSLENSKYLPIVKEEFYKGLTKRSQILQVLSNLYTFMTEKEFTIEQKQKVLNVVYKLVYLTSQLGMNKEKWKIIAEKQIVYLSQRFANSQQKQPFSEYQPPVLSPYQAQQLLSYIKTNILPFYQIWQKLLDQNQHFILKTSFFNPIQNQDIISTNLSQAKKLQINQILALQILKPYIGQKPPVQEKKDPKKK